MHIDDVLALGASRDRHELRSRLLRSMTDLGFERMTAQVFVDGRQTPPEGSWIDNTPESFYDTWSKSGAGMACPVMQHVKHAHTPVTYDQRFYCDAGAGPLWEEQAPFGYASGVTAVLHLPQGRHFVLGFDRDRDLPPDAQERARLAARLQFLIAHAVGPALTLLDDGSVGQGLDPRLTAREREVLQWTLLGKSSSMTAEITGLSFSTVNFHLRNAMQKLRCNNKHVAACRAHALGLLSD